MLESVINISEGNKKSLIIELKKVCSKSLLDVHVDRLHNRSVFTLAGENLIKDVKALVAGATKEIDLTRHKGLHPRFGSVDVVPFIPIPGLAESNLSEAVIVRDEFIEWCNSELEIAAVPYEPEMTLPQVRKLLLNKRSDLVDQALIKPKSGVIAVGARRALIAYNILVIGINLDDAKLIASNLRSKELRILSFSYEDMIQISCNLVAPWVLNPYHLYRAVHALVKDFGGSIISTELVGLMPKAVLNAIDAKYWGRLDIGLTKTIEYRLSQSEANT